MCAAAVWNGRVFSSCRKPCVTKNTSNVSISNFSLNWKKTPTECYKLLQEAYGDNSLSRARVFKWCKRFSEGRESTEDDQHPGRPVTVSTQETVTKINQIVRADRRKSIRMIAEAVNADKETCCGSCGRTTRGFCTRITVQKLWSGIWLINALQCSNTRRTRQIWHRGPFFCFRR